MHNAAGGFVHRRVHNSIKSSTLSSAHDHVYITSTPLSALITSNSLDIFVSVFYACHKARYLFSLFLHLLRVRSVSGDPLLCSHIDFSWISTDFIRGGQVDKVRRNSRASHSDTCVHTCTSSGVNTYDLRSREHV